MIFTLLDTYLIKIMRVLVLSQIHYLCLPPQCTMTNLVSVNETNEAAQDLGTLDG